MNRRSVLLVFALGLVGLALYGRSLAGGFVYDDHWYIQHNPAIRTLDWASFFTHPETTALSGTGLEQDVYRPLVTLSYAWSYRWWKLDPFPYHLENILLHIVNAWLLFWIARSLLRNGMAAGAAAIVFLIHPVQVQSVAWVAQRSTVLGALFFLCSLWFLGRPPYRGWALGLGWICYGGALLCKESSVIMPGILVLVDAYGWRPPAAAVPFDRPFWVRYAGLAVLTGFYGWIRWNLLGHLTQVPEAATWGWNNLSLGLLAFPVYVGKLLLPLRLRPSYDYPHYDLLLIALCGLILIGYLLTIWLARRKWPVVSFALAWIAVGLLPFLHIIPLRGYFIERALYIPLMGLGVGVGWLLQKFPRLWMGVGAWIAGLAIATFILVPHWHSEESLWAYAVRQEPTNAFAHACYAQSLGNSSLAIEQYYQALMNRPSDDIRRASFQNLAVLFHHRNEMWKARYWAGKAKG
jgi:hypothetical protein